MTGKPERPKTSSNQYLKYSGMAVQLLVLIGAGAWIGQQIDKALSLSKPYFTILLILVFTGGFFYRLVKDLSRKDEP